MSWRRAIAPALCVAAAVYAVHASSQASADTRDEIAALRAELARRPSPAPGCTIVHDTIEARTVAPAPDVPTPALAAPATADEPKATADEPEQRAQTDAVAQAHDVVAQAIRAGHLTAADGAELRRLHAEAGASPEFASVAHEIVAGINQGTLVLDGDPRDLMP